MTAPKHTLRSEHCLEGQVDIKHLVEQVRKILPAGAQAPAHVTVTFFVEVPGGGDWSYTELNVVDHPVKFRATWTEEKSS